MKTFKFSLVLRTRENTDVFISLDDNIYGIHSKRINILYIYDVVVFMFAIEARRKEICASEILLESILYFIKLMHFKYFTRNI